MDHLHAYWRMEYIKAPERIKGDHNPFKHLPEQSDEDAFILARSEFNYIVLNRFPYNAGHLMVIPFEEIPNLEDMDSRTREDHFNQVLQAKKMLENALSPDGFNIGYNFGSAAGAGIPSHLHCHIVPRWEGDTNFMPIIGDTHVLPESLAAMWKRLREFI